jgi:hypothetical protein
MSRNSPDGTSLQNRAAPLLGATHEDSCALANAAHEGQGHRVMTQWNATLEQEALAWAGAFPHAVGEPAVPPNPNLNQLPASTVPFSNNRSPYPK